VSGYTQTGVHLVSMPWYALGSAPLALAVLRGIVERSHPAIPVTEYYAHIRWAEYLLAVTDGRITPQEYQDVADRGIALGLGDWVFAGAMYDDPAWRVPELRKLASTYGTNLDVDIDAACWMRELADDFIEAVARDICAASPLTVCLTTTFMQTAASLALARRIKREAPATIIVLGGANCDGPMGAAIHRNHRFVDYVVRGEAEFVLPELIDIIAAGKPADGLDGVCWWDGDVPVANPQRRPAVPANAIAGVSYDAWHADFSQSPVREYVTPWLVLEGSRGCWWGQRHHCTFCGLNDATLLYRRKPADRFFAELTRLVTRHQILDILTSDDIMDMSYFRDLLPRLAETGWDLRLHFEMKANLTEDQVAQLASSGIGMVQLGIENFSTRVLRLMDKGVDGASAVRVLRDCLEYGISVGWNYLYGFPGELASDYWSVISQLPALVHLQPPAERSSACRIVLDRFSPYFERPELGFAARTPAAYYQNIYDLPAAELADIAYNFDCPDQGIDGMVEDALNAAVGRWAAGYAGSSLHIAYRDDRSLVLDDRRAGWPNREIELTGWQRDAYLALRKPRRPAALADRLAAKHDQVPGLERWLGEMREQGLVFCDDGRHVALATRRVHAKLPPR
jgi:ribosomal peptide maturation radical SAM protein 1